MIYSRWRADGGYGYFRSTKRYGLGDDLPTPRLQAVHAIGVPSTSIGRDMPADARWAGRGPLARGAIVPMDRSGMSGLGVLGTTAGNLALLTAAALFGWWLRGQLKREWA